MLLTGLSGTSSWYYLFCNIELEYVGKEYGSLRVGKYHMGGFFGVRFHIIGCVRVLSDRTFCKNQR